MNRSAVAGLVALALLGTACTDIPTSSQPQVIQSGGQEPVNQPANPPQPGEQPLGIVSDFLAANADSDVNHAGARQYLTSAANARWSDDTVTVLNTVDVGAVDRGHAVSVNGPVLGRIDADGVFTPVPTGDGSGVSNKSNPFVFQTKLVRVPHYAKPQWRIDKLQPGLIVDSLGFQQEFQQRSIYFYDAPEQHLVPEPHYTQLLEPQSLANWLIRILATGPPDGLSGELPANTDPSRVSVAFDANATQPVDVVIPGALQLDPETRKHLAVEVAATLSQVASIGTTREIAILDGSTPATITGFGTTFTAKDFANIISPTEPAPQLYYVSLGGGVVNAAGVPLPGRLGSGYYDLTSVALATDPNLEGLLVAGTRLNKGILTLDIGQEGTPLDPVPKITGALSRPEWAPDAQEVWIGVGKKLYRVSESGAATPVPLAAAGTGQAAGRIAAVRLSPEGDRIALVLDGTDTGGHPTAQVWVGVVVRQPNGVKVQGLTPITPTGVMITDVGWNDALKLFAIGHDRDGAITSLYEVQCDGSRWTAKGMDVVPGTPDSITVATGEVAVVSASNAIWEQNAGTWQSLHGEQTNGIAPIYVH